MLNLLFPVIGCGLMMVLCMAVMSGSHRGSRHGTPAESMELMALRSEVAELRKAVQPPADMHLERNPEPAE